jgi:hypothetical protein
MMRKVPIGGERTASLIPSTGRQDARHRQVERLSHPRPNAPPTRAKRAPGSFLRAGREAMLALQPGGSTLSV